MEKLIEQNTRIANLILDYIYDNVSNDEYLINEFNILSKYYLKKAKLLLLNDLDFFSDEELFKLLSLFYDINSSNKDENYFHYLYFDTSSANYFNETGRNLMQDVRALITKEWVYAVINDFINDLDYLKNIIISSDAVKIYINDFFEKKSELEDIISKNSNQRVLNMNMN